MNTIHEASQRILHHINTLPGIIAEIGEEAFCRKPAPAKWSKKEILGHLIDSAANNHQRIIRTQYQQQPSVSYDQNKWNELNRYYDMPPQNVIDLWVCYNRHLALIITYICTEHLQKKCDTGDESPVTLEWLIIDYVRHMEHHLEQINEAN